MGWHVANTDISVIEKKSTGRKKRKVPRWIPTYFRESVEAAQTLFKVVRLGEHGIAMTTGGPERLMALVQINKALGEDKPGEHEASEKLERAKREAEFAQSEIDKGFPVLRSLAVVGIWSWLEHFVKGFAVMWICNNKDVFSLPAIQKLKIKFGDYIHLDKSEQAAYLVEILEQETASSLKRGVTRFETLLEVFSLDGNVPPECAKALFELQQIRNVVAHRNSKADRRIIAECPWLKLKTGQPLEISDVMMDAYGSASIEYLMTILRRVCKQYGRDIP